MPYTIREWIKLDPTMFQAHSHAVFGKLLLDFIRQTANSTFRINDISGSKLLRRLRVAFSHLREQKLNHNFLDAFNPLYHCSLEAEDTYPFFLCCQNFSHQRKVFFFDNPNAINFEILKMDENDFVRLLLFW